MTVARQPCTGEPPGLRVRRAHPPDQAPSDPELLARLRAGEDAAFGELFARHADVVRRLALTLADDRAEAEDLTAEAFFRVLQAIRRGSGPVDNVRAYLLIVARRVAIEWRLRRKDVPVTDEELDHRAGYDQDPAGQLYERNLIVRAFTSLPERWRNVLWKVEVEGERLTMVASMFGLSPNATAALARRARRGLRAAYLQAHLATERGATGCRSVLEKLGAYTVGNVKGAERRRIRAHLTTCGSCRAMHDELRDVCSGLRAHAGLLMVPAPLAAFADHALAPAGATATAAGGAGAAGFATKTAMALTSVAAAGVLGITVGPVLSDSPTFGGEDRHGTRLVIAGPSSTWPTPQPRTGSLFSYFTGPAVHVPAWIAPPARSAAGGPAAPGLPGDTVPTGAGEPRDTTDPAASDPGTLLDTTSPTEPSSSGPSSSEPSSASSAPAPVVSTSVPTTTTGTPRPSK
jgi:RNA polymerase sigma factor (sigma-70 family)